MTRALRLIPGRHRKDLTYALRAAPSTNASRGAPARAVVSVVGILLLALTLQVPAAAAAQAVVADISFSYVEVTGNLSFNATPVYLLQILNGPGSFAWRLNAERVTLNVTRQTFAEAANPTDPSQALGRVATGPPEKSEYEFANALLNSTSRSWYSSLVSDLASIPILDRSDMALSLTPSRPNREPATLPENDPQKAPANATWATGDDGLVVFQGDFSIDIWDAVVSVRNDTTTATFESGNWSQGGPVRERHEQSVRLDARNAKMEVQSSDRAVSFATPTLAMTANLTANFRDVEGALKHAGKEEPLMESQWSISGALVVQVWNPVANGSTLQGHLEGEPTIFGLQMPAITEAQDPRPELAAAKPAKSPTWLWVSLILGVPGLALVALRRYGPGVSIDDVEWALLEGRPRYAQRLATRFLRFNKHDPTGIFFLATALMARGRPKAVLRHVEPRALKLRVADRLGSAFLLAESARRIGDRNSARRWAEEAAKDPTLLEEMVQSGRWPELVEERKV